MTLAAIRLKSAIKASYKVKDSFKFVNLNKRNRMSLVDESMKNILIKLNPYIAWGEISDKIKILIQEKMNGKKFIRLSPITLKSAKQPYPKGDLGYRKDMDDFVLKSLNKNKKETEVNS